MALLPAGRPAVQRNSEVKLIEDREKLPKCIVYRGHVETDVRFRSTN